MVKYEQDSSANLPPTPGQVRIITRFCMILRIQEPLEERMRNRAEANRLYVELRDKVRVQQLNRKRGIK